MKNQTVDYKVENEKLDLLAKKVCIGFVAAITLRIVVHVGLTLFSNK